MDMFLDEESMFANPYQTAFYMIKEAFSKQHVDLQPSLEKCNLFIGSDCVILHKINSQKSLLFQSSSTSKEIDVHQYIEQYLDNFNNNNLKIDDFNINNEDIKRITFVPLKTSDSNYLMTIVNSELYGKYNDIFMKIIIDTYEMILEKKEYEEKLKNSRIIDELTNLYNRNGYMERIESDEVNETLSFAIADLFRLKYVNDNFSHVSGDNYISIVADLLKKVFMVDSDQDNKIYRIGGDEFVIMCSNKSAEYIEERIELVNELLSQISNNDERDVNFCLNYGVSSTEEGIGSFSELYSLADERQKDDKTKKYRDLGIERRS